jgi:8-oxo-dGTP pyrophosphatase MutT (NUDIX family)
MLGILLIIKDYWRVMLVLSIFKSMWADYIKPLVQRPRGLQVGALCHRQGENGREVLLISSSSGRWILPKGWPIDGLTAGEAAQQEAWEEAGIKKSYVAKEAVGTFLTKKRFDTGAVLACDMKVFSVAVSKVVNDFPEADRRKRVWVSPKRAAEMVDETGLKTLLADF